MFFKNFVIIQFTKELQFHKAYSRDLSLVLKPCQYMTILPYLGSSRADINE